MLALLAIYIEMFEIDLLESGGLWFYAFFSNSEQNTKCVCVCAKLVLLQTGMLLHPFAIVYRSMIPNKTFHLNCKLRSNCMVWPDSRTGTYGLPS